MSCIEDIVENTLTPSLLTNSIVGMVGFMDLHKVVARRKTFLTFWNAWNGVELEGEVESEELKCQFSQVEKDLDLQKIFKPVPISNKKNNKEKGGCDKRWKWKKWKKKKGNPLCSKIFLIKKTKNRKTMINRKKK